jgi:hypothetical protein
MKKVKIDKAMGWACMSRQIGDAEEEELTKAIAQMLQEIFDSEHFTEILSCIRLIILNKNPHFTPEL